MGCWKRDVLARSHALDDTLCDEVWKHDQHAPHSHTVERRFCVLTQVQYDEAVPGGAAVHVGEEVHCRRPAWALALPDGAHSGERVHQVGW